MEPLDVLLALAAMTAVVSVTRELVEAYSIRNIRETLRLVAEARRAAAVDAKAMDEADLAELARIGVQLAAGEITEARHSLERLLDDLEPDWRTTGR